MKKKDESKQKVICKDLSKTRIECGFYGFYANLPENRYNNIINVNIIIAILLSYEGLYNQSLIWLT